MTQTQPAPAKHRMRWYVYAGGYGQPLQRIPHTATMRGQWPGWDAECSCGKWESRTGGGVKSYVERLAREHREEATRNDTVVAALAAHLPEEVAAHAAIEVTPDLGVHVSPRPGSGLTEDQLRAAINAVPGVHIFFTMAPVAGKPAAHLVTTEV